MIVLDESIRAIVFAAFADRADYMAGVSVNQEGPGFVLTSRIRWHSDRPTGDPFLDGDRKQWFRAVADKSSLDEAVEAVRDVAAFMCKYAMGSRMLTRDGEIFVLVRGDDSVADFAAKLRAMPFAYEKIQH